MLREINYIRFFFFAFCQLNENQLKEMNKNEISCTHLIWHFANEQKQLTIETANEKYKGTKATQYYYLI